MFLPRIIPVLLLKGNGLVKTTGFKNPRYIGDPINAVKIFNDQKADELIFLDINASKEQRSISLELVSQIGDEAYMPVGIGGGINNLDDIEKILKAGAEKVIINSQAHLNPDIIKKSAEIFGSQSIVVSIDVKKNFWGKYRVKIMGGEKNTDLDPVVAAKIAQDNGAGEIIINSMDKDGTMSGYDLKLIKTTSDAVSIPVVACGGAGSLEHLKHGYYQGSAHAIAAGSMFIYHGRRRAVLINYPSKSDRIKIFGER